MIPAVAETSEASIYEMKFLNNFFNVTKFSKEWKICPKMHFLVFALLVGNFSNKHHYNLPKNLRIFCFWYFCPKWLFPELFVLKVDLCIKVVALIKITTVYPTRTYISPTTPYFSPLQSLFLPQYMRQALYQFPIPFRYQL